MAIPALKLITPAAPIVSWGEAKAHLRIDDDTERALVEGYIAAATQHLDAALGILGNATMGVQTWELYFDAFPAGSAPIKVPLSPLVDVPWIFYFDAVGFPTEMPTSDYFVDIESRDGWIVPSVPWPATIAAINVVTVRFRAGSTVIPAPLRQAILLMVGHFYENREAVTPVSLNEVPMAVDRLIAPYRRVYV